MAGVAEGEGAKVHWNEVMWGPVVGDGKSLMLMMGWHDVLFFLKIYGR